MANITRGQRALHAQLRSWNHSCIHPRPQFQLLPIRAQSQLFSTSSSQQSRRPSPSPPTTTTVSTPSKSEINAPISTHPATLTTPSPLSPSAGAADKLKRLVGIGRAYLTFYKTGLKNVYHNYRASLPLRRKIGLPAYIPISPHNIHHRSAPSITEESKLGRAQFQLVRRSARDVRRMIPFTMILIVCGELTPLIVPFFGSAITPATCRVPSQVEKERGVATVRKLAALDAFVAENKDRSVHLLKAGSAEQLALLAKCFADPVWVAGASSADVLRACAVFGLVKHHNRTAGEALAGLIYRPRLAKHVEYLANDDGMIRGGGVSAMNATEVRIAVEERGGVDVTSGVQDRKRVELERRWLEQWLAVRGKSPKAKKL
ncbi:hypothetical protein DTO013E5_3422 [Penicillium roqueforti]|uniref:Letm1 RBD domain-containing protein n=1 Tax=Penicillium roqueforti (strain FM164) TaxID=1365484 RepID=W6Q6R2_PENRF|nr:uncharacterized protein LCP9604111_6901 [Penicillium roqueforti]CDM32393.1 hypothetical protein PROQFM164_S02g002544 [Penicillium roqueforti FM164]KAF9245583.1 hypothetical protein LCP9604111_6901 [Penicillium roqueforti]KAI1832985.1 hypothetical protein CBS147337_6396 [Penicillium roqueforti]KAI2689430.1 hypothetical protein LCP963914a_2519 [Penicillium roqueforti]KAI2696989.1 hypothetical protein CBS147372_8043 [Penicillium roqueforti]